MFGRERTQTKNSILRLEGELNSFWGIVGAEGWNPDSQVDVHSLFEFFGSPLNNPFSFDLCVSLSWNLMVLSCFYCSELNPLSRVFSLDNSVDVYR